MTLRHIIVVEDNEKHRQDAIRLLGDKIIDPKYPIGDLKTALKEIREVASMWGSHRIGKYIGVLTDLYFPARGDDLYGEPAPLGLLVMAECQKLGIPCMVVTAGYHHGTKYHQAHAALREMGLMNQMVDDSSGSEAEAEEKNWKKAVEQLEALAAKTGVD